MKKYHGITLKPERSHFIMVRDGHTQVYLNEACYARFREGMAGITKLKVLHPTVNGEIYKLPEYVDWLLNSEFCGEAFLTKTYSSGMRRGFRINIDMPTNFLFMALAALRYPWESTFHCGWYEPCPWAWGYFRDMGFDELQSLHLANKICISEDKSFFMSNGYNSNHIPFPRHMGWSSLEGRTSFHRQKRTLRQGASSEGVTGSWVFKRESEHLFPSTERAKLKPEHLLNFFKG